MAIYIFLFSFLSIGSMVVGRKKSSVFLFVALLFMGLIIGLRDISVGTDTMNYVDDFNRFSKLSFAQMWHVAIEFKEPLYVIISWMFSLFSHNYTFFLLGWAMFPTLALYHVLKDELRSGYDYIFAFLVIFVLGFFAFFVAGVRQTAALSIIFITYSYIRDKKLIPFLICMGIAYLLHRSSLVFLLAYPIRFFKLKWQYTVLLAIIVIVFMLNRFGLILYLSQFFFDEIYAQYGSLYESSQNTSALYMQGILLIFCFYKRKALSTHDEGNSFLFMFVIVGLVFQAMAGELAEMSRVAFYFCIFQIILFPKAMREYDECVRIAFIITSLFYLFFLSSANLPVYHMLLFH